MTIGDTGVGKTVLAAQFIYEGLLVGDNCIFIACDEPPNVMRLNMANFRLGTVAYEQVGRLVFIDAYARERSTERVAIPDPNNLDEFFAYERDVIEQLGDRPVRLVLDSISTIFGTASRASIIEFNRHRLRHLRARHVLTLDNYVTGLLDEQTVAGLSHAYPLIVKLGFQQMDGGIQRFLQLGKLRSGQFSGERAAFRIDPRVGIVVQR
jgi:KaiC/GvpD/RAD55 family RecA-like ATPase